MYYNFIFGKKYNICIISGTVSSGKDKPDWLPQSKVKSLTKDVSKYGPLTFYTVKLRGLAYKQTKKHIKQFFRPIKPKSIRIPPKIKGIAYVGFKTEQAMKKALLKNKSFLGKNYY